MSGDRMRQSALAVSTGGTAVGQRKRTVVLDEAFERLPREVQPVEGRIAPLERGHHPQRLRVVIEAAAGRKAAIESALSGRTERRVAEIMGERERLRQILV